MKNQIRGTVSLLLCTMIWGSAFVAQSAGMDYVGPFTFQTVRSILAVISLIPMIWLADLKKKDGKHFFSRWKDKRLWRTGLPCGAALFAASGLQQMGMVSTDAGKAGFITAMYLVIVPVLELFFRRKPEAKIWVSVVLAVIGMYFLSCMDAGSINAGDICILISAFVFAVQILMIDRNGQGLDCLRLNFVQFLVTAVLSSAVMFWREQPQWDCILRCRIPLLYAGVFSSAVAYSLQIIGQQYLSSEKAALIMSLESVFALIFGWLILHQTLTASEMLGCGLVFSAVILSQLPGKLRVLKREHKKAPC